MRLKFEPPLTPRCPDSPRESAPAAETQTNSRFSLGSGVLVLLALSVAIAGWLVRGRRDGGALAQARQAGVIRIGYAVEAPYAFLTPEGQVTGESPEIARVIAARLGIPRVEWRLVEFGDLIAGLEARRFDVIAAGMFITPQRQQRVAFSLPTFQVGPGLLVRKGNPLAIHSYADLLQRGDARVAVLTDSAEEARLLELGCPDERLVRVPDAATGREAVRAGHVAGLALSAPTVRRMAQTPLAGLTEMAEPFADLGAGAASPPAQGGFAFRHDEPELCRAWNAELARFLGSEEHRRLVRRFGFTEAELPPSTANPGNPIQR